MQTKLFSILLLVSALAIGSFDVGSCQPVEKVKQQYALLLTGQIDKMLGNFSDNATWIEAPTQWGGVFSGKDEIKGFFFNRLFSFLNVNAGTGPIEFLNSSYELNQVAVLGRTNATVKSTNKSFESDWVEVWTFGNDGNITKVENYYDAAKMAAIKDAFSI